jgi:[ribosomal protein S18]-alanine N-acetyltransferase
MTAMDRTGVVMVGSEHADVLAALYRLCFEQPWPVAAVAGALDVPGTVGLVACRATTPVGFILYRLAGGEGEILGLGVVPAHRRGGIGRRLLSVALTQAEEAGAGRMVLEVAVDNDEASRLYASTGFEAVGQRRNYYTRSGGARTDALILARCLKVSSRLTDSQTMD